MTDTPPTNVSILAAEVTLTGATLNPGNVSLLSTATTVELTRLQTDIAYLGTTNVIPGTYTSLTLTFANPSLTIENDTGSAIGTCAIGAICTMPPTTVANLSTTIILPTLVASANTAAGLLVDVNLQNLLSPGLGADFRGGTTVSEFTPAAATASPLVEAEDVVGQVTTIDAVHNTFSFQNATGQFSLLVDSTTTFFQFPSTICSISAFACLQANQILSVDISFRSDGTPVARNVVFEDSNNSDTEVEGIITSTNLGSQQFSIVTLAESARIAGLKIGDAATAQFSTSLPTVFDVDFVHADATQITPGFSFAPLTSPTDLFVGQQVQLRRNPSSTGLVISADRVRLRSSRVTATVQTIASPTIFLTSLPFIFSGHAITQIQAQTFLPTIFLENGTAINLTFIPRSGIVSVRGPLFNAGGTRTLVTTKVVLKP